MGRFKSNVLAQPHCYRPPRDSLDLDGRLSGSLAAFKFAISAGFEKTRSDSFRKAFAPRPIPLFQKMRGWLSRKVPPEVNIPLSSFHGPNYEGFDRCHLRMACPVHDVEGATRHRHVR